MKVGIMTMQRIVNYGSFLQAYSLMKTIEELGHEVEFVDYEPGEVIVEGANIAYQKPNIVKRVIRRIKWEFSKPPKEELERMKKASAISEEYKKKYRTELLPILRVKEERNYRPKLDALVIGSDEVFNCLQTNPDVGYAKELFGANSNADIIMSYAGSFGNTIKENLDKYNITNEIKGFFNNFDYISVRDTNSKNIVESLVKKEVSKNVDPVFLYDYNELLPKKKMDENYIIVYAYGLRITEDEAVAIKAFAAQNNKKIICMCAPQKYLDNFIAVNPFEILAYFRDADYIITDTFHGSVFSIKYNKNFAVYLRSGHEKTYGNSEKLYDLLKHFEVENRIITEDVSLGNILNEKPDFVKINNKIDFERNKSIKYLTQALGKGEK